MEIHLQMQFHLQAPPLPKQVPSFLTSFPSPRSMSRKKLLLEKRGAAMEEGAVEGSTEYRDGLLDLLAIRHISHSLQATAGIWNTKKGYESLIEAATAVARNFDTSEQERLVIGSLNKAIPRSILKMIRKTLRPSKFTRECFAFVTTVLFPWLVGPSEVRESEFQGHMEKNVVYIKKCRFLESTNCVGICTYMCKLPSQRFIKESLGMPVNMVPNFEDMSCEMVFGEEPPAAAEDPAFRQPCYKLCKANQSHVDDVNCSTGSE